ncbi:MAG: molybdopterin cofactor-binding domain-containing protein, partial [Actinomycetota bacterium]
MRERPVTGFSVNGAIVEAEPSPRRLSEFLREDLGLRATKVGCNAGDCGACTVLVDGEPVAACMVPLGRLDGHRVETLEGLDATGEADRLQRSFVHHGAAQCGICTPGMLVSACALLRSAPTPSEPEVRDALGGVLCRCTGYRKIVEAVLAAPEFEETEVEPPPGKAVGWRLARLDGDAKVRGLDVFGDDAAPPDALLVRVVRSPLHRARFTFGDLAGWVEANPGVVAVHTAADVPGRNRFGVIASMADQPVFAEAEVRFRGEAVAMVTGEPEVVSALDLGAFPVTWEELEPVMGVEAARAEGAPRLHADREGNVLIRGNVRRGDLDPTFGSADVTVEASYETTFVEHAYIEPEAGFALRVGDRVEVHVTTQSPHMDREELEAILGLPPRAVRIVPTAVGGGFGSKLDLSVQPYVALAAWHLGRPVRIVYTRPESMMSTTKRHPARMDV